MKQDTYCLAYLDAVLRCYGLARARASLCHVDRGWYYVALARRFRDGSVGMGGSMPQAVRKKKLEQMTLELLRRAGGQVP